MSRSRSANDNEKITTRDEESTPLPRSFIRLILTIHRWIRLNSEQYAFKNQNIQNSFSLEISMFVLKDVQEQRCQASLGWPTRWNVDLTYLRQHWFWNHFWQKWKSKSVLCCLDWIRLSVEYIKVCIVLGLGDSPTLGEVNLVATTSPNNRRLVSSTLCTHASLPHTLVQYLLFAFSLCSSVTILLL